MAQIPLKLKPFRVPNFVVPEETGAYSRSNPPVGIPIHELPKDVLEEMIEDFRRAVRKKWEAKGATTEEEK